MPYVSPLFLDLRHDVPKHHHPKELGKSFSQHEHGALACNIDGNALHQILQQFET